MKDFPIYIHAFYEIIPLTREGAKGKPNDN